MEGNADGEIKKVAQNINPQEPQSEIKTPEVFKDKSNQQVENKFNLDLEQEKKPGEPKISIHVFFSPHETEKDIEGFEEHFRQADVFIPEGSGWTAEYLRIFRELSEGKLRPENVERIGEDYEETARELDRVVYDSHKLITLVDLPKGHSLDVEDDSLKLSRLKFGPVSFEPNLIRTKDYFQKKNRFTEKKRGIYA